LARTALQNSCARLYLWPQHERIYSTPELINWVNTALVNHQVPVALICTDQFAKIKVRVEKQIGWTSEQLEHRVSRYRKLPSIPTREDVEADATKLLALLWNAEEEQWNSIGPPPRDFVRVIVGYALTCKLRLPAVANTIEEARYQARMQNRSASMRPTFRLLSSIIRFLRMRPCNKLSKRRERPEP
jgi:hypothetical protein